jgi:hypothetical protein
MGPRNWVGVFALLAMYVAFVAAVASASDCRCMLKIRDQGIDLDRDGVFDALEIRGETWLEPAGTYSIDLTLGPPGTDGVHSWSPLVVQSFSRRAFSFWHAGRWPSRRPLLDSLLNDGMTVVADGRRPARFALLFDGESIGDIQRDGPWTVRARFLRQDDLDAQTGRPPAGQGWTKCTRFASTKAWSWRRFGAARAYCRYVVWQVQPDRSIDMTIPLHVKRDGRLDMRITGAMRSDGQTFKTDTTVTGEYRAGTDTARVILRFRDSRGQEPVQLDGSPTQDALRRNVLRLRIQGVRYLGEYPPEWSWPVFVGG